MKKIYFLTFLAFLSFTPFSLEAASSATSDPVTPEEIIREAKAEWESMTRKERRMKRKEMRKNVKSAIKDWKKSGSRDTNLLLLVIITILLPPLGMFIYEGEINNRFWISLLLWLLLYLPGLIYTLIIILGEQ